MANAIKITELPNIGAKLTDGDIVPIVDYGDSAAATPVTMSVKVDELATHIIGLSTGDVDLGSFLNPLLTTYDFGDFD